MLTNEFNILWHENCREERKDVKSFPQFLPQYFQLETKWKKNWWGDLVRKKIANRITKVSKNLQCYFLEVVTNEHDKEIPKERYGSPEKKREIIDELKLN